MVLHDTLSPPALSLLFAVEIGSAALTACQFQKRGSLEGFPPQKRLQGREVRGSIAVAFGFTMASWRECIPFHS